MKRSHWYYRQAVTQNELNAEFANVEDSIARMPVDLKSYGILSGMGVYKPFAGATTTNVRIESGVAIDKNGNRIAIADMALDGAGGRQSLETATNGSSTAVVSAGNEVWVSVFARWGRVKSNTRTDGNNATVYYEQDDGLNSNQSQIGHALDAPGSDGPTTGQGQFYIVKGTEANVGSAIPPSLDTNAVLISDFRRTYGTNAVEVSLARTEYALRGLTGHLQFSPTVDVTGNSVPAKYRLISSSGSRGTVGEAGSALRVYSRTVQLGQGGDRPGGIVITQGCYWNDRDQKWHCDSALVGSPEEGLERVAGAIILDQNGTVKLCSRQRGGALQLFWNDEFGSVNGWAKVLEIGSAGNAPNEPVHMRLQDGGIAVVKNGMNTEQHAILAVGSSVTGVLSSVVGSITFPQPFAAVPSTVSWLPITGVTDSNVGEVTVLATTRYGVVFQILTTDQQVGILRLARDVIAYT